MADWGPGEYRKVRLTEEQYKRATKRPFWGATRDDRWRNYGVALGALVIFLPAVYYILRGLLI